MIQINNISLILLLVPAAILVVFLAVWAVINQVRDSITGDTIHYIAMYNLIVSTLSLSFLVYRS